MITLLIWIGIYKEHKCSTFLASPHHPTPISESLPQDIRVTIEMTHVNVKPTKHVQGAPNPDVVQFLSAPPPSDSQRNRLRTADHGLGQNFSVGQRVRILNENDNSYSSGVVAHPAFSWHTSVSVLVGATPVRVVNNPHFIVPE